MLPPAPHPLRWLAAPPPRSPWLAVDMCVPSRSPPKTGLRLGTPRRSVWR